MKLMRMLAVAALLASSHLVYGQDEIEIMSANIPFAFTAAGASMPAGHYVISCLYPDHLWKLRTYGHAVFLTIRPRYLKKSPANSALLFDLDANGYTLRQVRQEAQTEAVEVWGPSDAKEGKSAAQQVAAVTVHAQ